MTYDEAKACNPLTLAQALEKAFWRAAGNKSLGAGLPETWKAVEKAAMKYLREMNDENRAEQAEIQIEKQRERS